MPALPVLSLASSEEGVVAHPGLVAMPPPNSTPTTGAGIPLQPSPLTPGLDKQVELENKQVGLPLGSQPLNPGAQQPNQQPKGTHMPRYALVCFFHSD